MVCYRGVDTVSCPHPAEPFCLQVFGVVPVTLSAKTPPGVSALPPDSLFEPYQIEGSEFIASRVACILADDPRLGKTRQVLRAIRKIFGHRIPDVLIVTPAGARLDWQSEIRAIVPPLAAHLRVLTAALPPGPGVNLCSYEYTVRYGDLLRRKWDMVIIDEAHYLMNRDSGRTKALYGANCADGGIVGGAGRVVLLSATLQPKDPSDLWTHLRRVFPGLLRTVDGAVAGFWKFFFTFCNAEKFYRNPRDRELGNNRFEWRVTGGKNLDALARKLAPIMLRRTFKDVYGGAVVVRCVDLPVTGSVVPAELDFSASQRAQIIAGEDDDSYAAWLHAVGRAKVAGVAEYISARLSDDPDLKMLVFAWHRDVMQEYAIRLREYGVAFLPGGLSDTERAKARNTFRGSARVCVAQMAAAGEGIDLSSADECVLAEPSAVPRTNWQCGNRMVNLKKRGVLIMRFALLQGSLDYDRQRVCLRRMRDIDAVFNRGGKDADQRDH